MLHKDDALLGMTRVPQCHRNSKNIQLSLLQVLLRHRQVLLRHRQVLPQDGKVGRHLCCVTSLFPVT